MRNTIDFLQMVQMAAYQLLYRIGHLLGIIRAHIRSDGGQSLDKKSPIDEDCGFGHGIGIPERRKPQGIGLARDRRSWIQDGSGAYCHGADMGKIMQSLSKIKQKFGSEIRFTGTLQDHGAVPE